MNKKGRIVFWSTLIIELIAVILLLAGEEMASIFCLILVISIMGRAISKGINYDIEK